MFKKGALKTTLTGFAGLLTGVVSLLKGDITTGVTAIVTSIGLVFAKDF